MEHQHAQNNKGMAILAYLGILIIIPFLTPARDNPFVKFHLKQGIVLIISFIIGWVIQAIPILGWFVGGILFLCNFILVIVGIVNVASDKQKELPVIGHFAKHFNF